MTHAQGYYGTLVHNVKAVVQHYLGWYDGNPSRLHALPPVEAGTRYVAYMGGAEALLERAQADFEARRTPLGGRGDEPPGVRRPDQPAARALCAAALEQLGFASRIRHLAQRLPAGRARAAPGRAGRPSGRSMSYDLLKAVPMEMFLDCLAIRLAAERAGARTICIGWHIVDAAEHWTLTLGNAALTYRRSVAGAKVQASVAVSRDGLAQLLAHEDGIAAAIASGIDSGRIAVDGDARQVHELLSMLDEFEPMFNVVEP